MLSNKPFRRPLTKADIEWFDGIGAGPSPSCRALEERGSRQDGEHARAGHHAKKRAMSEPSRWVLSTRDSFEKTTIALIIRQATASALITNLERSPGER